MTALLLYLVLMQSALNMTVRASPNALTGKLLIGISLSRDVTMTCLKRMANKF